MYSGALALARRDFTACKESGSGGQKKLRQDTLAVLIPGQQPSVTQSSSRAENGLRLLESIPIPRLHSSPLSGALASLRRKTRRCQHLRRERQLCCSRGPAGGASRRGPSFMRQPEGRGSLERVGGMGAGAVSGSAHPVFSRRRLVFKDVINGCVSVAPREEAKKDCHVGIPFCHRRTHGAENDGRSFTA